MGCPPRPGVGSPSLPPLQHRDPAFLLAALSWLPANRPATLAPADFPFPMDDGFQAAEAGWNCSSSVEPLRADSELSDPEITWFTVSK